MQINAEPNSAAARYAELEAVRQPILNRARESSRLTIPTLIPPSGHNTSQSLPTPYQGIGAMGVNNLASKLLLAILPPNTPFFKMQTDDFALEKLTGDDKKRAEIEEALNTVERAIMGDMEARALRTALYVANKHLIVGGNVLIHVPPKGSARVFPLDKYVVKRDPSGNVLEIIIKESLSKSSLPSTIRDLVEVKDEFNNQSLKGENTVDLYTRIRKDGDRYKVHQEIENNVVPESEGFYPKDRLPWLALRWSRIDGEDYGRGMIEEYYGDLKSLEGLMKSIVEGTAIAARTLVMVHPNSSTKAATLSSAKNGDVITGNMQDIDIFRVEKSADFQVAFRLVEVLTERLSMAFLLNSAVQRDAERVTAEEVRYVAGLLEDSLGGFYSLLSQELQLPLVTIVMHQLTSGKRIPDLPKEVKPIIVTGLEALGRNQEIQKLQVLLNGLQSFGGEAHKRLNIGDFIKRLGTGLSIDMDGLIKDEEQVKQEETQMMLEQMMSNPQMMAQLAGAMQQSPQQPQGTPQNV